MSVFAFRLLIPQRHTDCLLSLAQEKEHFHTSTNDLAQEDLLQKYQERVERLSQQNRVIKICTDAGFLTTVDVGKYFMTKDTEEFSQFTDSVTCREYILPREMKHHLTRKVGFDGTPKLGPCWKLQPVAYMENMEWKLEVNL